jgi:hypothetical protein
MVAPNYAFQNLVADEWPVSMFSGVSGVESSQHWMRTNLFGVFQRFT